MIAAAPREPVEPPRVVREIAGGSPVHAVWENELGGMTFRIESAAEVRFVKWSPPGLSLSPEVERLRWAAKYAVVPRVLDHGSDSTGEWMVTAGLPGRSAVDDRWIAEPGTAVRAIGSGLRALHETVPVADCPFDWSAEVRTTVARRKAAAGSIDQADWPPELPRVASIEEALDVLADAPPVDRAVVCHGDACAPNTLIGDDGRFAGHVDLGGLGVADRWADLAIATMATRWNYGPGWEGALLDAYGISPDQDRTTYYRLLWYLAD
ncbi:aminoglycoside 3'-phosphotransferase [Saccharopolyspora dendranthemae]|uniref:Kanamycin kinase n=1 Tax=Saccharopolyspora dendranthemae TaxID=1181886 RepID=A0A561V8Q8_9PSEU|nr:aminoglycoside 3'-phosphotransferase [Saccharopolyspora dendranthemae]TWG08006.1 kanamycin kinase [Saccharopolyspora dendranthemae]